MLSVLRLRTESLQLKPWLFLVLAVLLSSGCDGGIFGTGDSNSDEPLIAASPPETTNPLDGDEMPQEAQSEEDNADGSDAGTTDTSEGNSDGEDDQSETGGEANSPESAPDAMAGDDEQTIFFDNSVAGYPGVEPQLRFVNAGNIAIRASIARMSGEAEIVEMAPLSVTRHSTLEIGETIISLSAADPLTPTVRILASLGLSSVSTVLVHPVDAETSAITALALPTQSATEADSLAQLRIVVPASDSLLSSAPWSLTPSGTNPGAADATLNAIIDASSDATYTSIAGGDYELRVDGQSVERPVLTLNGGTVTTLVVLGTIGNLQFIEVVDSDIEGL